MSRKVTLVLLGGLVAGACDITYATVFSYFRSGVPPMRILQSVASGLLGRASYEGGWPTALLGLGLHFFIAIIAAAVFFFAARRLEFPLRRPLLWGAGFGVLMYGFMNMVVLQLSRVPPRAAPAAMVVVITGLLVHMFGFGVPIALAARRAYAGTTA
jgi:hypothetical protein